LFTIFHIIGYREIYLKVINYYFVKNGLSLAVIIKRELIITGGSRYDEVSKSKTKEIKVRDGD
jgi:hypothetical protein